MRETTSEAKKKRLAKRLKIVEYLFGVGKQTRVDDPRSRTGHPSGPSALESPGTGVVLPASDLNEPLPSGDQPEQPLETFDRLSAPVIIIRNEKRMLQEAVDALFDNGKRGRAVLRNLRLEASQIAERYASGETGSLPPESLGKRVDYSGRSVIVVGPELRLHQSVVCPRNGARIVRKPFIYHRLEEKGDG